MIEKGNPSDTERFIPVIEAHQVQHGCVPITTIADGGYANLDNIVKSKLLGVKRVGFHKKKAIAVSKMGLKKLRDFRASIEGNISELKRAFGAGKVLWKGEDGFMCR